MVDFPLPSYEDQLETRPLDPNVKQCQASDPDYNIWVNASAGTGKTKVLTDRVLRLLLPRHDGRPGSAPEKILCITFTKAGASEMILRVQETLARWITMEEGDDTQEGSLRHALLRLFGRSATVDQVEAARRLFRDIVDMPGGLKIMTIHSFCQSVLARFPLEAGLLPQMRMLDETEARMFLQEASQNVLAQAGEQPGSLLSQALDRLGRSVHETHFLALLESMMSEREVLLRLKRQYASVDGIVRALYEDHDLRYGLDRQDILHQIMEEGAFDRSGLKRAMEALLASSKSKTDQERGNALDVFLACTCVEDRIHQWDMYRTLFLTQGGDLRQSLCTKAVLKQDEGVQDILQAEAQRVQKANDQLKAQTSVQMTEALLHVAYAILDLYAVRKQQQGCLDFDDQILKTLSLLQRQADWVMYKLDRGIDHILLDEAQDTNPEQWDIVEALYGEFFTQPRTDGDLVRTVFVVGDEKQSIYGFQRASPEKFATMREALRRRVQDAGHFWRQVDLQISFRSTPSVLRAVDLTFASDDMRAGVSQMPIYHESFRRSQAGFVGVWPVTRLDPIADLPLWEAYKTVRDEPAASAICAQDLAQRIRGWLDDGRILSSAERPIRAGDIMILVRKRTDFVRQLMRSLKAQNIPVAGADRMRLGDQICVQDMLALCGFCLLPDDDLTLACLLKSPLIGVDEATLFDLAHTRTGSLWEALKSCQYLPEVVGYLKAMLVRSQTLRPYEFLSEVLFRPCPASQRSGLSAFKNRLGEDVADPLKELLSSAMTFEAGELATLQMFYEWAQRQETDLKREQDSDADMVRIMTVHGSKGLQAPIVILPDCAGGRNAAGARPGERILWPAQTGLCAPIWCPRAPMEYDLYRAKKQILRQRADQEDKRLLYVAMTRAEEELYITGYHQAKGDPSVESWHAYIAAGLRDQSHQAEDGTLSLYNARTKAPDRCVSVESALQSSVETSALPAWLTEQARREEETTQYVAPSRLEEEENGVSLLPERAVSIPPLTRTQAKARGLLIHKMLEVCPDLSTELRQDFVKTCHGLYAHVLSAQEIEAACQEALAVLSAPDFQRFFTSKALVEMPIMADVDSHADAHGDADVMVSGIVDRVCFCAEDIWVLDYKTGYHHGDEAVDMPASYRAQLRAYQKAIQILYPKASVRAAIIWTRDLLCIELPA